MGHNFQKISFLGDSDDNLFSSLKLSGYSVFDDFVSNDELIILRSELLNAEKKQIVNTQNNEYGQVRLPHLFSEKLCNYLKSNKLINIFDNLINTGSICHLYNGQICRNEHSHNQSLWHRDLNKPYISSPPLAYNALLFLGESDDELSLHSQKFDILPSSNILSTMPKQNDFERNMKRIIINPGQLLIFDSLLWHRVVPCKLNNQMFLNVMFTAAFLKQQINLLGTNLDWIENHGGLENQLARILGYWSRPPKDIDEFRNPKDGIRTYRSNQG